MSFIESIPLHETARTRYLNYALSVITSRALPDVRDGLKPVQRRILYAMHTNLHLYPEGRFRKSATVVGEVMGKYHPHGDSAIYEAMVRMAQSFSLRAPLVDGHGNFGSLDGDAPAAMRYTEVKLRPLAMQLLDEIKKRTVDFRPTFDGTLFEPVVLPARAPNLLVNGATGIAVGMATNIPPHNLGEVVDAALHLIGRPEESVRTLVQQFIKGPDFPTGGQILNSEEELIALYENGEGPVDVRGEYTTEGKNLIVITSIPYGIDKSDLIEKIAEHIAAEKVPQLVDIRDESTEDVRIVLELRRGGGVEAAMAYLYKHTPLQNRFNVNLTCLAPTDNPEVCAPRQMNLAEALRHFLAFRFDVVTRRLQFDLEQLEKRIHLLRGFEIIFNALDEAIRLIRAARDKADAAQRLMHRFGLDEEQTDAVLETKLFKLAQLEIDAIRKELADKERQAERLRALLASTPARWNLIRDELKEVRKQFADARRTRVGGAAETLQYSAEDYIVEEDVYVIVTRDGWVKRQRSFSDVQSIRVREGDEVGWVLGGSTRASVCFLTSNGKAYTVRAEQLPSTTGYGDPIQKLFDFADRERLVGVLPTDPRVLPPAAPAPAGSPELFGGDGAEPVSGPYIVAVSAGGLAVRTLLDGFREPSTRSGRTYMKLDKQDAVVGAALASGEENLCLASHLGHVLIFSAAQIPVVKGAAKGVIGMKLAAEDRVLGFTLSDAAREGLEIETSRGRREIVRTTKFEVAARGNKGRQIIKRGHVARVVTEPVVLRLDAKR